MVRPYSRDANNDAEPETTISKHSHILVTLASDLGSTDVEREQHSDSDNPEENCPVRGCCRYNRNQSCGSSRSLNLS